MPTRRPDAAINRTKAPCPKKCHMAPTRSPAWDHSGTVHGKGEGSPERERGQHHQSVPEDEKKKKKKKNTNTNNNNDDDDNNNNNNNNKSVRVSVPPSLTDLFMTNSNYTLLRILL